MRRAEKEVKDLEQLEEILRDCNTVRIGTQDAEGMFIVPVNYGYDLTEGQLTLYLHSAREGRKAAAFRRGGAVASALRRLRERREPLCARAGQRKLPVLGRVGMCDTVLDATGTQVQPGEVVELPVNPIFVNASVPRVYL